MFAFKIWSQFGVFRDPVTITQNITLSIPPKTTIGGMMAAILGINYNDYFTDKKYFNFKYSVIPLKEIRKRSFAQNYIDDYTKKSLNKTNEISKLLRGKKFDLNKLKQKFTAPKPIFREILIFPEYLVFIKNYKYEEQLKINLKEHSSKFYFYMGNTEFPANFRYIDIKETALIKTKRLDTFTQVFDLMDFEGGKRYTNLHFSTIVKNDREFNDYKKVIFSNNGLSFKKEIDAEKVVTELGDYICEFI